MWIKINTKKFWVFRTINPVFYEDRTSGYYRLLVKDHKEDLSGGIVDLEMSKYQYYNVILLDEIGNPVSQLTVHTPESYERLYSMIETQIALEAL
jgi:hypothetical protein